MSHGKLGDDRGTSHDENERKDDRYSLEGSFYAGWEKRAPSFQEASPLEVLRYFRRNQVGYDRRDD